MVCMVKTLDQVESTGCESTTQARYDPANGTDTMKTALLNSLARFVEVVVRYVDHLLCSIPRN